MHLFYHPILMLLLYIIISSLLNKCLNSNKIHIVFRKLKLFYELHILNYIKYFFILIILSKKIIFLIGVEYKIVKIDI